VEEWKLELAAVLDEYPQRKSMRKVQGTIDFGDSPTASVKSEEYPGVALTSADGKWVAQLFHDKFVFSRLAPYSTWGEIVSAAKRVWGLYVTAIGLQGITRLSVRYINRIDFPPGRVEFEDYFRTFPQVSKAAPDDITGFMLRLELPQTDLPGVALLQLASTVAGDKESVAMILDIDVLRFCGDPGEISDPWEELDRLRDRKNKYFEATLTDATRALFGRREEY